MLKKYLYGLFMAYAPPRLFNPVYKARHADEYDYCSFPRYIFLESVSICNAACVMCPRELLTRKQGVMSFDLFEKIVSEIRPYAKKVERVDLHGFGEPAIDRCMPARIRLVKAAGIKHVHIVSNGSLMQEDFAKAILEAGLDSIKFSFYGSDKQQYEDIMVKLKYEESLGNINRFIKVRNAGGYRTKIIVQALSSPGKIIDAEKWGCQFEGLVLGGYVGKKDYSRLSGDLLRMGKLHNYGGGRSYLFPQGGYKHKPCYWPFQVLTIDNLGNVLPCIYDFDASLKFGNLTNSTIAEIWNSERFRQFRQDMGSALLDKYSVCCGCSQFNR
ncbi:MAG TPA: hypothetical protein DIS62_00620 [Candidatus Kerfeldbacteria bacterium]|nr:hypothetical protein [Candidatus Kerfeldbacteria bacterium]